MKAAHFYGTEALIALCGARGEYSTAYKRDVTCARCKTPMASRKQGQ